MVVLQCLNKIINTNKADLIIDNNLTREMFIGYENEFDYIINHYNKYHNIPDKETFLSEFPEFDLVEVQESDKYLLDKLNEEWLYYKTVPVIQNAAELLKANSEEAVDYLLQEMPKLTALKHSEGVDIIHDAAKRFDEYSKKLKGTSMQYITTGFEELDTLFKGFARGEELVVLFARIGQGKSWILSKMLSHAWQLGLNVGMISPEMTANKIGYRFDTLTSNFNNRKLVWGEKEDNYEKYINNLKNNQNKFIVSIPQDFNKKITVSKLKNFCIHNKIDILGIDGITYLTDERYQKGDSRTTMLTNISEDLMSLSIELQIPILVVVQSNRGGVRNEADDDTPDLENIKDSDGIAANATKVIAIRRKINDGTLQLCIRKHRDGLTGQTLIYNCDFNTGNFQYIPSKDDGLNPERRKEKINKIKQEYKDKEDVF